MNLTTPLFCLGITLIPFIGSCARYKAAPIDLAKEEQGWKHQTLSIQSSRSLDFSQARQIGLVLNTELNKARLQLAASKEVAKQSGWWNDPAFSWDIKQVLQQDERTINLDGGLAFTIPVTGLPALEKQVASHYKEADYWSLRQSELDFLSSLEQQWSEWAMTTQKVHLVQKRLAELKKEETAFASLSKLGEIDLTARQIATQRLNSALNESQSVTEAELQQRQGLIRLLGMHPEAASLYQLKAFSIDRIPSSVKAPSTEELMQSPKILSKLASYSGSETLLKTEIRKQFPEIEFGPAFTRDDGEKELGGSTGFNIPLWNRNRKGIAEAEGTRNKDRLDTVSLWKELLQATQQASSEQTMLLSHCQATFNRVSDFSSNLTKLEKLHKIGETSLADIAEARQQVYESKLALIDSLDKLMRVQSQLRYVTTAPISKTIND